MKFLIVAPRFHTNLYYRVIALHNAGHTVRIIVLNKGKSEYYKNLRPQQVKLSIFSNLIIKIVSIFNKSNLKSNIELRLQSPNKEFEKIISTFSPDVIILKAYQNALAIKTLRIAKKQNVKVLMLTQTNFTHIKGSEFLFKLNIKLFKYLKVCAYITPIKSNYEAFKKYGINNVYYLPFVFPKTTKFYIAKFEKEIKILSIGKFVKRKEQILLLKAFNFLLKEGHQLKLCLIGELSDKKYFEQVSNYIKENMLSEYVCIKPNLHYDEVILEYKKNDIFILPSYSEPAAYSPVEALANGLPVICSDQNGTKCYIKDGVNGYIFEAKKVGSLIEKIKQIISNQKRFLEMKQNSVISAKENHNLEGFEKNIIKIIKN